MKAMVLETPGRPLVERDLPRPRGRAGQVLLRVRACAVCRTDLHILDGELAEARLPLVPPPLGRAGGALGRQSHTA